MNDIKEREQLMFNSTKTIFEKMGSNNSAINKARIREMNDKIIDSARN